MTHHFGRLEPTRGCRSERRWVVWSVSIGLFQEASWLHPWYRCIVSCQVHRWLTLLLKTPHLKEEKQSYTCILVLLYRYSITVHKSYSTVRVKVQYSRSKYCMYCTYSTSKAVAGQRTANCNWYLYCSTAQCSGEFPCRPLRTVDTVTERAKNRMLMTNSPLQSENSGLFPKEQVPNSPCTVTCKEQERPAVSAFRRDLFLLGDYLVVRWPPTTGTPLHQVRATPWW